MNLFRVRTIHNLDPANGSPQVAINGVGQCFVSANWADWPLVANTQIEGNLDWTYPDGVANELQSDETLMLQTHYVNAATQETPDGVGQVGINLYGLDPSRQVKYQMGTIFATNQSIRICERNPTPTYSASCQVHSPTPVTIIGANGHFHSRGKQFDMYMWDGTSTTPPDDSARFYQSIAWAEPPMLHSPDLAAQVVANGGVWYTCSYQWQDPGVLTNGADTCGTLNAIDAKKYGTPPAQQDCCYTFGGAGRRERALQRVRLLLPQAGQRELLLRIAPALGLAALARRRRRLRRVLAGRWGRRGRRAPTPSPARWASSATRPGRRTSRCRCCSRTRRWPCSATATRCR